MSDRPKRKTILPLSWALYAFVVVLLSVPGSIFIIMLSFQGQAWEEALHVTNVSRWVAIPTLLYLGWSIWFLIGTYRKIIEILRGIEE